MSSEERFLEAIEEEQVSGPEGRQDRRHERLAGKNRAEAERFLGKGKRTYEVGIAPRYYGELLAWALKRHLDEDGWQVLQALGYRSREPVYIDVNTGRDHQVNLLIDGQMLVQKGGCRLIVTVDISLRWHNSILVEGSARAKRRVAAFVAGVMATASEQNFYRGKKVEFAGRLRFLDVPATSWDSIILDPQTKAEIRANTTGFLSRRELWDRYGIPPKRGIILAGEPGTGKTLICKAIMAEAEGITCITTNAYGLDADEYVTELYELAQDLSPCIVFIEDLDLIGQSRVEFGYQRGPALLSLLTVLDGVEERKEIVTVATTNCLDTLDKALSERPSRFDRVIRLAHPSLEQRRELVSLLSRKIPLDQGTQDYIARKAESCTPAQLQEIIYSLAIEGAGEMPGAPDFSFSRDHIDSTVSKINGRNRHRMGFCALDNHNGNRPDLMSATRPDREG